MMSPALGFAIFGAVAGLALEYISRGLRAELQSVVRKRYPNHEEMFYSELSFYGSYIGLNNLGRWTRVITENERYLAPAWYALVGVGLSQMIYWGAK